MEHPEQKAEYMKAAIDKWIGNEVTITKEEEGDIDRTTVLLTETEVAEMNQFDNYILPYSLRLKGPGFVFSEKEKSSLPNEYYEIPFEHISLNHVQDNDISFSTDRAVYNIRKNL